MIKAGFLLSFAVLSTSLFAQHGNFKIDQEYSMSKTGTIDLRSSDADVFITGSSRSTAHVKIERTVETKGIVWGDDNFSAEVKEENGNLVIRDHQQGVRIGVIGYQHEVYKIQIEAPEGVTLKINGDDGDYFIKNINGSISMDIDDGDAELSGCAGTKFNFTIDDGDISMNGGEGDLEIRSDDSDVTIQKAAFTSIRAKMDDGDMNIETSLAANGDYSFDAEDGSVVLTITDGGGIFDIRHDDARVVTEGNFKSIHESEDHTQISLSNGTAKINIRLDDGGVRLIAANSNQGL
jgi:hypothetical protein